MDIKVNSIEGRFKFRVCGILEHNGKYLIVKINHNKFYCLPGGHIELGEDTETAVKREMKEELGWILLLSGCKKFSRYNYKQLFKRRTR